MLADGAVIGITWYKLFEDRTHGRALRVTTLSGVLLVDGDINTYL